MSQLFAIPAEARTETGKGYAKRARREGRVPAVMYGPKIGNRSLHVPENLVERFLASGGAGQLVDVTIGAEKHTVLVKEIQRDPARGDLLHIDFHKVDLDTEIETSVALVVVGEDSRANDGGFVTQSLRELTVACLPTSIPEQIEVDVSGLGIGETLTVGEIAMPEGVRAIEDPEMAIVTIAAPRKAEETGDEAGDGEGAEAADAGEASGEEA